MGHTEEEPETVTLDMIREQSHDWKREGKFWVTYRPTANIYEEKNEVLGIILHHTAVDSTVEYVVNEIFKDGQTISCHVVIDEDGTRFVLAEPETVTWHAGLSKWGDRFRANLFTIGIEFHGNTVKKPLTDAQIESAVEYMRPIIREYNIRPENIVTHEMVREEYRKAFPKNKKAYPKVDITPTEYQRVMHALDTAGLTGRH